MERLVTQVYVAFPRQPLQAGEATLDQSLPVSAVPLKPRLADLDHSTALPSTTEEDRHQGDAGAEERWLMLMLMLMASLTRYR